MPAVGKTALALNIANSFIDKFPDSQLYIDCFGYTAGHTPLNETEILDSLITSLQIPTNIIPKTFSEKNVFWHSMLSKKRMIIIFDNINSVKQIENILPKNGSSLVLITSRNNLLNLLETCKIMIDVLDEQSAVQLLYKVSGKSGNEYLSLFKAVAKKCEYLPLALQVIASRMKGRKHLKFVERFIESNTNLDNLAPGENPVFESFDLSYVMLDENSKNVLKIMGICPCIEISLEICAIMLGEDEYVIGKSLDLLYEQHLIEEIGEDRYRLHDLIRDFARMKYIQDNELDEKKIILHLINTFLHKINSINQLLYPNEYSFSVQNNSEIKKSVLIRKNSESIEWLNLELNNFLSCLEYLKRQRMTTDYIQFLYTLGSHIRRRLPSDTVIQYGCYAKSHAEKMDSLVFLGLCNTYLALAYEQSGNFLIAIDYFNKAEMNWESLHNYEAQAYVLSNKGFTLERLGNYPDSIEILKKALRKYQDIEHRYGEGFVLNAIGAVNWRMKKYPEAKSIFIQALAIREKYGDEIGVGSTTNNLGFTYLMLNDENNAIKNFKKSLDISRAFGDLHGESVTTNNLGYYFIHKSDYQNAIKQALIARKLANQVGNEYQIARSYDVEAKALIGLSDWSNARLALKKAIRLFNFMSVPEACEDEELIKSLPS